MLHTKAVIVYNTVRPAYFTVFQAMICKYMLNVCVKFGLGQSIDCPLQTSDTSFVKQSSDCTQGSVQSMD